MPLPVLDPDAPASSLRERLSHARYEAYTYSYPHKTAYRPFSEPIPLADLWREEDRSALFLYVHVPFCEMRCGFCNLFTTANPQTDLASRYLDTLEAQAHAVRHALGDDASFARVALGGGTPTFLTPAQLERVYDVIERVFGASLRELPTSLETSPRTATRAHLELAKTRGVDRISIGIQSFVDDELRALGRPSSRSAALEALERIASAGFGTTNIDLIYGARGQTLQSFQDSLELALGFEPEEVYLYPLYVRPLTGLDRRARQLARVEDPRAALYEDGRARLLEAGYEQRSLRMFSRPRAEDAPTYRCQEDGMVGLGCGARSYTRAVHYSDDFAVSRRSVRGILEAWVERAAASFDQAHYGAHLDAAEQRRRYLIQSLGHADGLDRASYAARFGTTVEHDFPRELAELAGAELIAERDDRIVPTARGFAFADVVGPWLYSREVQRRMQEFELR